MSGYEYILVAVDVCDDFTELIEKAVFIANINEKKTRISIIHVVEPVYYPENYMGGLIVDVHQKSVDFAIEELAPIADKYPIREDDIHVVTGRHANTIHEFAEKEDADLIVVGSHGKQGLQLLLGSTATAVLHGAHCDVLAVRVAS